ncbi:MAG: cyclic pyranopterin monophosphate synthase MoaC [Leptolyngbya sp. PLA3]|nr:MAG: cyclic pyranopterin monophosphate synthase MoaC [Cyanobacteria bacterium CYA]MCE7969961.1 cyclic pyranopterin monophosphate synthase MoaC [Leptolyngbya sp. PL-A3]
MTDAAQPARPAHLSHVAPDGGARMVDVGAKPVTARSASAEGFVRVSADLEQAIRASTVGKGSVLEVARLAGIMAAKRTDELVPLCHTLPLDAVDVRATLEEGRVHVTATVRTQSRTGVEMEALTAVTIACLTVIDMGKAIDRAMVIEGVRVTEKHGGRSGPFTAPSEGPR